MRIIVVKLVNYDLLVQIRVKILQKSIYIGGLATHIERNKNESLSARVGSSEVIVVRYCSKLQF